MLFLDILYRLIILKIENQPITGTVCTRHILTADINRVYDRIYVILKTNITRCFAACIGVRHSFTLGISLFIEADDIFLAGSNLCPMPRITHTKQSVSLPRITHAKQSVSLPRITHAKQSVSLPRITHANQSVSLPRITHAKQSVSFTSHNECKTICVLYLA